MKETEVPDAHFTVDKQNISLWPQGKCQLLFHAHLVLMPTTALHGSLTDLSVPSRASSQAGPDSSSKETSLYLCGLHLSGVGAGRLYCASGCFL